jgi:RNA polymerase sigma-70 factor (ECF subfamily)
MRVGSQSGTTFSQAALGHLDSIYSYAASLCDSPAQAEALVQATYRCAARAFGSLAPDGNLKSRLYAIARNIWLNQVHCGAAVVRAPDPHAFPADGTESQGVRTALERLPRPYREVIVLHEFEGLSYCEIASIVHCPAGTVFSRLDRGRERLRRVLSACRKSAPQPPLEVTP